jgi:hypothetical protein
LTRSRRVWPVPRRGLELPVSPIPTVKSDNVAFLIIVLLMSPDLQPEGVRA